MSRIGVISDIHGNLHALQAVLDEIDATGVDSIVCLGDVVGYGPDPGACLELVDDRCDACVFGNHEEAVINPSQASVFNPTARTAIEYTVCALTERHVGIIERMPARIEIAPGISCIHESPVPVDAGGYVRSTRIAGRVLEHMTDDVCFIGHTHVPAAFMLERDASATSVRRYVPFAGTTLTLRRQDRYLLNPGSVGQPRDGDWRASWGLLDLDRSEFSLHRVGYQVSRAQLAFSSAGLPSVLGERLRIGA